MFLYGLRLCFHEKVIGNIVSERPLIIQAQAELSLYFLDQFPSNRQHNHLKLMKEFHRILCFKFQTNQYQLINMHFSHQNQALEIHGAEKPALTSDLNLEENNSNYKSRSLKATNFEFESSFSENVQEAHIEAIWDASVKFLEESLLQPIDKQEGLNNGSLFPDLDFAQSPIYHEEDLTIQKILSSSSTLTFKDKNQLATDLKNQRDLTNLIEGLYEKFHPRIFSEILLVIKVSWEKYLEYKKKSQLPKEFQKFFAPRLFDLSADKIQNFQQQPIYLQPTPENLTKAANEVGDAMSHQFFISPDISYINLRQIEAEKKEDRQTLQNFKEFIKSITRGVFLCTEGCFVSSGQSELVLNSFIGVSSRDSLQQEFPSFGEIRKIQSWK